MAQADPYRCILLIDFNHCIPSVQSKLDSRNSGRHISF
jgi:hypothetical protein